MSATAAWGLVPKPKRRAKRTKTTVIPAKVGIHLLFGRGILAALEWNQNRVRLAVGVPIAHLEFTSSFTYPALIPTAILAGSPQSPSLSLCAIRKPASFKACST